MSVPELLTIARKLNNYKKDATAGGLWTDTTHYRVTVPANKRWFLIGGVINRDVSSVVNTRMYDSGDSIIGHLFDATAAIALTYFPWASVHGAQTDILEAGEYIESVFGTAQSTAAYHSCMVLEVDA